MGANFSWMGVRSDTAVSQVVGQVVGLQRLLPLLPCLMSVGGLGIIASAFLWIASS